MKKRELDIDAHGLRWPGDSLGERRELDASQVDICRRFLAQCTKTKTAQRFSYSLKHVIENWAGSYVSNGACIRGALDLGLVVRPLFHGFSAILSIETGGDGEFFDSLPLNAFIGVSKASIRKVRKHKKAA